MWFDREISNNLRSSVISFPAVLVTGARQVGKTSLLQHLFPHHHFVTLDLPSHAALAEKRPEEFIQRFPPPLIIDEVQYAPGLFRHLKVWIDQNRDRRGQFLLTGSQKFALMQNISESLAGRCAILELETLSLPEILSGEPLDTMSAVVTGGYPELHACPEINRQIFYQSYLTSYLERDVRNILKVTELRDFERFVRACALRSATTLNKADLARDIGISPTTANQWISVLEASNQILLLEPWFGNRTKSLVKSPKLYLADTGLLCHLLGIDTVEHLRTSPLLGNVWETFVFSELRKRQIAEKGRWELWYWRNLRGLEIDFLIHRGGRFDLFECKTTETPNSHDTESLQAVAQELGRKNVTRMSVISRSPQSYPITQEIMSLSIRELR